MSQCCLNKQNDLPVTPGPPPVTSEDEDEEEEEGKKEWARAGSVSGDQLNTFTLRALHGLQDSCGRFVFSRGGAVEIIMGGGG